jgi:hypothetical protein
MPPHDPRILLAALPDERLFKLARNPSAPNRLLAVAILVERCSKFIRRKEIASEVEALLATTPANND